jgi:exodeoxyribonuclease VIII
MLKTMNQSWRVFEAEYVTRTIKRQPSPQMEMGTAIHCAALEPERYFREYVEQPEGLDDRRTKAYKDWAETVHPSQTILKHDQASTVRSCIDALNRNPIIRPCLKSIGVIELSHEWTDSVSDVPCRMRPDKIIPRSGIVLDIKTIRSCTDGEFAKSVADFGYHIQAAHYLTGVDECGYKPLSPWVFIFAAVETSEPFRCRAYSLDSESLDIGRFTRARLLDEYVRRLNDDDWSDERENELIEVSLPNWFKRQV